MKRTKFIPLVVLLSVLLTGCEKDGPAEEAGEHLDEFAEDVREGGEELGEDIEDACEEVKEEMGAEDEDC